VMIYADCDLAILARWKVILEHPSPRYQINLKYCIKKV
jgi:hypothetical protein